MIPMWFQFFHKFDSSKLVRLLGKPDKNTFRRNVLNLLFQTFAKTQNEKILRKVFRSGNLN